MTLSVILFLVLFRTKFVFSFIIFCRNYFSILSSLTLNYEEINFRWDNINNVTEHEN